MAIGFLALLLINVALFVVSSLLLPKPKLNGVSPNIVDRPTVKEDILPVVWGTMSVPSNVTHFSNQMAEEQKEKVTTGLFSSSRVTVGYKYSAIFQATLCHGPVDELVDIVWSDIYGMNDVNPVTTMQNVAGKFKPVTSMEDFTTPSLSLVRTAQVAPETGTELLANAPELFGGYKHGGGVQGWMRFYWGLGNQVKDPTLSQASSALADFPAYRGVCYMMLGKVMPDLSFQNFVFGEFGTVPSLNFIVRRCPSNLGLGAGVTNINGGANPAECIYETLTNTVWGQCVPTTEIDTASFVAAANTLAAEGFGIHLALVSEQQGSDIIQELCRYIDGQLFQDPVTGLLTLTLNRADYVLANLVNLDDDNSTSTVTRPLWTQLVNQVKVIWTQKQGTKFKQVPTQPIDDIAAQRDSGIVHSLTVPFPGVRDPVLANRLGIRSLKVGATPLKRATVTTTRIAAGLRIGAPFKLSNAVAGVNAHVFRVVSIDFGKRTDGKVQIEAVEDIFNLESPLYTTPIDPPVAWTGVGPVGPVRVTPIATSDETTGYLEIVLDGGNGLVTDVEFSEKSGGALATAWHANNTPDKFYTLVDLDLKNPSVIFWRVRGNMKDGTIGNLAEGEINYPPSTLPARPTLSYRPHSNGFVDLVVDVDQDADQIRYYINYDHVPTLDEVLSQVNTDVPPGETRLTIVDATFLDAAHPVAYAGAVSIDPSGNAGPLATLVMNAISAADYTTPVPVIGPVEVENTVEDGDKEGRMHIPILLEFNTDRVVIYATEAEYDPANPPPAPDLTENSLSQTIQRHEGVTASSDDWFTEADIATTKDWSRRIICLPIGPTGLRGEPFIIHQQMQDIGVGPTDAPSNLSVVMSTVAGKARATITWVNGDATSFTRLWRNGIVLMPRLAPGVTTFVDDGLSPNNAYTYKVQHIKNGQTSAFNEDIGDVDSGTPQLQPPTWAAGYPVGSGYQFPFDDPPSPGRVALRVDNPDPSAYTDVYMSTTYLPDAPGVFVNVYTFPPGGHDIILNAEEMPMPDPTNQYHYFYLVSRRPGYTDSTPSATLTANFGTP